METTNQTIQPIPVIEKKPEGNIRGGRTVGYVFLFLNLIFFASFWLISALGSGANHEYINFEIMFLRITILSFGLIFVRKNIKIEYYYLLSLAFLIVVTIICTLFIHWDTDMLNGFEFNIFNPLSYIFLNLPLITGIGALIICNLKGSVSIIKTILLFLFLFALLVILDIVTLQSTESPNSYIPK